MQTTNALQVRPQPDLAPPALAPKKQEAAPEGVLLETRFGTIFVSRKSTITMQHGPLGYEACHSFALVDLPDPRLAHFKLLQSLDHADVSFIVVPLNVHSEAIDEADLDDARKSIGAEEEHVMFLLIVTVRKEAAGVVMTANLRAPIALDRERRVARQCVLGNNKYPIRQPL